MNILIIGSGGREHAFAWKLAQSPRIGKLYIAPGNAGTSSCGINVNLSPLDFDGIGRFALDNDIRMILVGPEDPLVKGIHDYFLSSEKLNHIPVIGPCKTGAQLEGSKDFSKRFMIRHGIPTAAYETFTAETLNEGFLFLEKLKPPYVLKADGLAGGKGVVIPETLAEAKKELRAMLADAKFGQASSKVVIEEFLRGIELSVFVLTDGLSYKLLPSAKDYKRIGEGDTGLNTGGMGAVSPVPFADEAFLKKVEKRIVIPTISGLKKDGIPYQGFIFIGLMNCGGEPSVIEYNCRMGDPETEAVIPRIQSDLVDLLEGVATQTLSVREYTTDPRTAVTVMLVAGGYPESYEKGKRINGLEQNSGSLVFHAGTKEEQGKVFTNGGRVIAITSLASSIEEGAKQSMQEAEKINYEGKYYRKDIGKDLQTR
ncbi:MAG TPA: phosphoribosylamine--glycine ligase [Bacteroidia bacterium]|jgi:phosphoribosylamine--glycine ligase|nr:phosphoribosylamine--glycine ligase [Bacteroidia bacterium]